MVKYTSKLTVLFDMLSEALFRRIKINQRLFLTFIVLSIVPLCIIGLVSIQSSTKAMEENISSYSIQLLTQVSYNLENEIKKLEDLSMEIMSSQEMAAFDDSMRGKKETARLQALKQMESMFEDKLSGYNDIASIGFYPSGYDMLAKTEVLIDSSNSDRNSIFNRILDTNGRAVWIYMKNKESELGVDTDTEYSGLASLRVQTPVLFRKMSSMNDAKVLGVLHIAPKKAILQKIVSDVDIGKDGKVVLLDSANRILTSMEDKLIGAAVYPEIDRQLKASSLKSGYFLVNLGNTGMLVCYNVLEGSGWKVLSMVPFKNLTAKIGRITVFIFMLMAICILIALIVSYMVTRSVCIPINQINETVEHLGKGDFSGKLDIKFNDEISSFSSGFNKMIDDMQNLINEVYITKIEKLDSDFKALQAQINPHFLYNTLESINALAIIKKDWEISEMVRGLASVFRYSTKNSSISVVLKDEIEHVRLYILLQALRYEDRIKIQFHIPDELLKAKVIKFMLQPLVENAIIHGIEKNAGKGLIRIEAESCGNDLCISVSDNGKGMERQRLEEIRARLCGKMEGESILNQVKESIGILNIHSRIRLHFGGISGVSIDSAPEEGCTVKITIPLIL